MKQIERLIETGYLRRIEGRGKVSWQYTALRPRRDWRTADDMETAVERASQRYVDGPKLTAKEQADMENSELYIQMHAQYGHRSVEDLRHQIERYETDITTGEIIDGRRRSSVAMANQGTREGLAEALRLKVYLAMREGDPAST